MGSQWPTHEVAAHYAPLLSLAPNDPPGDPATYLARCRLVWWSNAHGATVVPVEGPTPLASCSADPEGLATVDGSALTRPFTPSPARPVPLDQGFSLEPNPRPPKFLSAATHEAAAADEFGRRKPETPLGPPPVFLPATEPDTPMGLFLYHPPPEDAPQAAPEPHAVPDTTYDVDAPCFYDIEALSDGGYRITYWLFYPTSTLPQRQWERSIVLLAATGGKLELTREDELPRGDDAELPDLPPEGELVLTNALLSARTLDDLFESELKPGEKVAWSSPWSGIFGDAAHELHRYDNVASNALAAVLTGLAMNYEIQFRLVADFFLHAFAAPIAGSAEALDAVAANVAMRRYIHEGDWEAVSVEIDPDHELRRTIFWGHGKPLVRTAEETNLLAEDGGGHVGALVAVGSHATVPDVQSAEHYKEIVGGPSLWRTWKNLRPAPDQDLWYGFGGAWGRVRVAPAGRLRWRYLKGLDLWKETTGPLGPGPLKLADQAAALDEVDRRAGHPAPAVTEVMG